MVVAWFSAGVVVCFAFPTSLSAWLLLGSFAFNHVLADLSIVVAELSSLAEFAAGARRLGVLTDALDREGHYSDDGVPELAPAATKEEPIDVDAAAAPNIIEQRFLSAAADPVIRLSNVPSVRS